MKVEVIIKAEKPDFSKSQLVETPKGKIILTSGQHTDRHFTGIVVHDPSPGDSMIQTSWAKQFVTKFYGTVKLHQ